MNKSNNTFKKAALVGATALLMTSSMAQAQEQEYYFVIPGIQMASAAPAEPEPELPYGLADNGITVQCDGMAAGETFELNGINYTVASSSTAPTLGANACTSNISNMSYMFSAINGNDVLNPDISSWDVSKVDDMSYMFQRSQLNQDISAWDVSSVTNMRAMFTDTFNFDQDISGWDTSSVSLMDDMFNGSSSFNQDLSGWCVTLIPSKPSSFDMFSSGWTLPQPVWGTCPTP